MAKLRVSRQRILNPRINGILFPDYNNKVVGLLENNELSEMNTIKLLFNVGMRYINLPQLKGKNKQKIKRSDRRKFAK
jgi:hypothetical protein